MPKIQKPTACHFHLIKDDYSQAIRVWRSRDPGDMFEMLSQDYLLWEACERLAKAFPNQFVLDFPQNDAGELVCNLCIWGE